MRLKKQTRINMALELQEHMTQKVSLQELMDMSKPDFLKLWNEYIAFQEADDELGDATP